MYNDLLYLVDNSGHLTAYDSFVIKKKELIVQFSAKVKS